MFLMPGSRARPRKILQPASAPIGFKRNFALQSVSSTQMRVINLSTVVLGNAAAWVAGGNFNPSGFVVMGSLQGAWSTNHLTADITASGISTEASVGGLDTGSIAANTDYALWLVSDGDISATGHAGLVWSANNSNSGPQGAVQGKYPYYAYLGWNRSNSGATGFLYTLEKIDAWNTFFGTVLPAIESGSHGTVGSMTAVSLSGFISPSAGTVSFVLADNGQAAGAYSSLAPNATWGSNPPCFMQNISGNQSISAGPWAVNGFFGYASTSANAVAYIMGFSDSN